MDQSDAFRTLASADRQLLLHELLEADGTVSVDDLSRRVAARRHRIPLEKIDERMVERARVRLVHSHLPHLEDRDLVAVDRERETVAFEDDERVARLFEAADELEHWPPTGLLPRPSS